MNTTAFRPLHDNILVKRQENEKMTKGGLYLPETGRKKRNQFAEVLAVGPGRFVEGSSTERVPMEFKPGQVIVFSVNRGNEIKDPNENDLVVIRADEVDGIVEEP